MKIKELKDFIKNNKEHLPLSYFELVYKEHKKMEVGEKIVISNKYKDSNYSIYKFYKPISKF